MATLMKHARHGNLHVYTDAEIEANKLHGWEVVEEKQESLKPAKPTTEKEEEREELLALADAQGVKYGANWSNDRIKQAIEAANK